MILETVLVGWLAFTETKHVADKARGEHGPVQVHVPESATWWASSYAMQPPETYMVMPRAVATMVYSVS